MNEQLSSSLVERLQNEKRVELQKTPSVSELEELTHASVKAGVEYGLQMYQSEEGKAGMLNQGFQKEENTKSIFEPSPPQRLKGKITNGVFVHVHPLSGELSEVKTMDLLPSFTDFPASDWSSYVGSYLNIASEYGFTMHVGSQGMSREDFITRQMRRKLGVSEIAQENVWKVWSGERAGDTLQDEKGGVFDDNYSLGEGDVIITSRTLSDGRIHNFVHLSWGKMHELEEVCGDLDNIFFGNGVAQIIDTLGIDVSHEQNLSDAVKRRFEGPLERNVEPPRPRFIK